MTESQNITLLGEITDEKDKDKLYTTLLEENCSFASFKVINNTKSPIL